jgi:hypothetical protein
MHQAMYAVESRRQMVEHFDSTKGMAYIVALFPQYLEENRLPSLASHFDRDMDLTEERVYAKSRAVANEIAKQFRLADTYWVQRNMVELVNASFDSMPPHPMNQETCPVPFGWMHLGQPVRLEDPDWVLEADNEGRVAPAPSLTFHTASWRRANALDANGRYRPGYEVWLYEERDAVERAIRRSLPNQNMHLHQTVGLPPYVPVRQFFWADGDTMPDGADSYLDAMAATWFQATMVLMKMPIAAPGRIEADRQTLKRFTRRAIPVNLITVVLMRTPRQRPDEREHNGEGREYSHRWLVRPFWRNQFYPSTGEHKVIYIHTFVKGPAGAPLVIKERVNAWVR